MEWRNWSGLESARPVQVVHPSDTEGIVEAVGKARADGTTVKMVGTGHSFTPDRRPRAHPADAGPARPGSWPSTGTR